MNPEGMSRHLKSMRKSHVVVACKLLAGALLFAGLPVPLPAQSAAAGAFDALKALKGTWESKMPDGKVVSSIFHTTAAGSAVVQIIGEGTEMEMPTVFHLDGDRLIATHYCASQNQPRMVLEPGQDPAKSLKFRFLDITNLKGPDAAHMREVAFHFIDRDHLRQEWTYREKGADQTEAFELVRKK